MHILTISDTMKVSANKVYYLNFNSGLFKNKKNIWTVPARSQGHDIKGSVSWCQLL